MPRISTFVFFDTETTGLPWEENNRTRITELSMVAVQREHILEQGKLFKQQNVTVRPRVINKITLCLNPRRMISDVASDTSGLTNDLLENQVHFSQEVVEMLDNFLKVLTKPVCIVSHNGHGFDFPIFKNHLEKISGQLPADILFADSLYGMYDIKEGDKQINEISCESDVQDEYQPLTSMQAVNENTPKKRRLDKKCVRGKKRRIYYEGNDKPTLSYKLSDLYTDTFGPNNTIIAHRAEDDCLMILDIAVKMGNIFLEWCDTNSCALSDINAMARGIRLGD